ncbi:MAG TPA: DUF2891 domain-containing protein [Thermoanaerobaculia bacterium]|nr:DUF2891 domain-containing protein [Thermoanaerobaculia bacterium]
MTIAALILAATLDVQSVERFANLALACAQKEYPNKIAHVLTSDDDVQPPRKLTPAFYGCYDWHSSVHAHWLLARLVRLFPDAPFAGRALTVLQENLSKENIELEVAYLQGTGRASFERPYGLAWLLQLGAELREQEDPAAQELARNLAPLERAAVERLETWLPKLTHPVRSGEHSQSAFGLGLMLDWARASGDEDFEALLEKKIRDFYSRDRNCPITYEPSGEDFLSPCIAEADAVRRVMAPAEYAAWLRTFLPDLSTLRPAVVTDPSDPKLAHLDGLNLSRAWMLRGIAAGLPANDARRAQIEAVAESHSRAGLAAVTGEHYEGGHWLGSFATYLVTGRGVPQRASRTKE